jgi:hypothetical protein
MRVGGGARRRVTDRRKGCPTPRWRFTQELYDEAKQDGWFVISLKDAWKCFLRSSRDAR